MKLWQEMFPISERNGKQFSCGPNSQMACIALAKDKINVKISISI